MIECALLDYGFDMRQVKILVEKGKIETTHGTYTIKDNTLILKRIDGTVTEIEL